LIALFNEFVDQLICLVNLSQFHILLKVCYELLVRLTWTALCT
jgi:hypothetical protein